MSKKQTSLSGVSGAVRSSASRYADDFKRDAVRLVSHEKYSFRAACLAFFLAKSRFELSCRGHKQSEVPFSPFRS